MGVRVSVWMGHCMWGREWACGDVGRIRNRCVGPEGLELEGWLGHLLVVQCQASSSASVSLHFFTTVKRTDGTHSHGFF